MDNFIGIYEKAYSQEFCEQAIKYFDTMQNQGFTQNRRTAENITKLLKDDDSLFVHEEEIMNFNTSGHLCKTFNEKFWEIYRLNYLAKYESLENATDKYNSYSFKIQKTPIGGGYHVWHYESSGKNVCNRLAAWMLYLNDVEEGGETEFLYYHKRVKPTQGTLLIWPAGYTHTHRGNPPISNDKYVITGWLEF